MKKVIKSNEWRKNSLASEDLVGKKIVAARFAKEVLTLTFEDGKVVEIGDFDQNCCEHRYMRTDDDVQDLVGGKFVGAFVKDGPSTEKENYDVHEIQFLEVKTNKTIVAFSSHNEHNGYYGGIDLCIREAAHARSKEI